METGGECNGIVFVFQKQNDHIQLEGNLTWFCKNSILVRARISAGAQKTIAVPFT